MKHLLSTSVLCLAVIIQVSPALSQGVPAKIRTYLNANYSGWKMTGSDAACTETKRYTVTGDFNGDRKVDYAIKFIRGRSGFIMGFVAAGSGYTPHVLERGSAAETRSTVLSVERKGKKYPIGGDPPDLIYGRLGNDAPYTVPCESDAVAFYLYQNGRFQ